MNEFLTKKHPTLIRITVCFVAAAAPVFTANNAFAALEIVDPGSLCERFEKKEDLKNCQQLVDTKRPDTYVASACQNLDDNKLFLQCLDFASRVEVDPKQLETCAKEELTDQERWSCLQKTAKLAVGKYQRLPASRGKAR